MPLLRDPAAYERLQPWVPLNKELSSFWINTSRFTDTSAAHRRATARLFHHHWLCLPPQAHLPMKEVVGTASQHILAQNASAALKHKKPLLHSKGVPSRQGNNGTGILQEKESLDSRFHSQCKVWHGRCEAAVIGAFGGRCICCPQCPTS